MTVTTIYLVIANKNYISFNKVAFFSKAKAHQHVTQLNIDKPEYEYTIQELTIIGD